jgi:hypothetical protein
MRGMNGGGVGGGSDGWGYVIEAFYRPFLGLHMPPLKGLQTQEQCSTKLCIESRTLQSQLIE